MFFCDSAKNISQARGWLENWRYPLREVPASSGASSTCAARSTAVVSILACFAPKLVPAREKMAPAGLHIFEILGAGVVGGGRKDGGNLSTSNEVHFRQFWNKESEYCWID